MHFGGSRTFRSNQPTSFISMNLFKNNNLLEKSHLKKTAWHFQAAYEAFTLP
jgi:hypothetical protein